MLWHDFPGLDFDPLEKISNKKNETIIQFWLKPEWLSIFCTKIATLSVRLFNIGLGTFQMHFICLRREEFCINCNMQLCVHAMTCLSYRISKQ